MKDIRMNKFSKNLNQSMERQYSIQLYLEDLSNTNLKNNAKYALEKNKQYHRQSSCSTDHTGLSRKYSEPKKNNFKASYYKEMYQYFQHANMHKHKRKGLYKYHQKQAYKQRKYSQLEQNIGLDEILPLRKNNKRNSFLSATFSKKQSLKTGSKLLKKGDLGQILVNSSLILQGYRKKCESLERQNEEIKYKYDILQKKIKYLKERVKK